MTPLSILMAALLGAGGVDLEGVVIDFTATGCPPCERMSPIVSRLERQGLPIRKVYVNDERELARRFNITGTPTFVLIIKGEERSRIVGPTSEDELVRMCARIPKSSAGGDSLGEPGEFPRRNREATSSLAAAPPAEPESKKRSTKSGFSWPFGQKKEEPQPQTPEVGRAKADARPRIQVPVQGNPLAATVRIRVRDASGDSYGSGTIIESGVGRTIIATCGHILRHADRNSIIEIDWFEKSGMHTSVGKPLFHDEKNDVGLIEINADCVPTCRVAPVGTKLMKGTPVVTVGCNGGEKPTVQNSKITYLNRYKGTDNIEVAGMPVEGRSGGGVFTADGLLIGVCSAADSKYKAGYYIGLKALHKMLDQCKLSRLYDSSSSRDEAAETDEMADNDADEIEEEDDAVAAPAPRSGKGRRQGEMAIDTNPRRRSVTPNDDGIVIDDLPEEVLGDAADAEVVCIIRPKKPGAPSRVVIFNQASRKFVGYLTEEIGENSEIQETTLTKPARRPSKSPNATQRAQRPAAAEETSSDEASTLSAMKGASQPYRRKTSR